MRQRRQKTTRREAATTLPHAGLGKIANHHHTNPLATIPAAVSVGSIPTVALVGQGDRPLSPLFTPTHDNGTGNTHASAGQAAVVAGLTDELAVAAADLAHDFAAFVWRARLELHSLGAVDSALIGEGLALARSTEALARGAHHAAGVADELREEREVAAAESGVAR